MTEALSIEETKLLMRDGVKMILNNEPLLDISGDACFPYIANINSNEVLGVYGVVKDQGSQENIILSDMEVEISEGGQFRFNGTTREYIKVEIDIDGKIDSDGFITGNWISDRGCYGNLIDFRLYEQLPKFPAEIISHLTGVFGSRFELKATVAEPILTRSHKLLKTNPKKNASGESELRPGSVLRFDLRNIGDSIVISASGYRSFVAYRAN